MTFNIHNERLTTGQFLSLENRILADISEARSNPHGFSVNIAGDLNVPPPGSEKRKLDEPSAEGPAENTAQRPYYRRWANIFAQLTEITTDAHTYFNSNFNYGYIGPYFYVSAEIS